MLFSRKVAFQRNKNMINQHNAHNSQFKLSLHSQSDMSLDEFVQTRTGLIVPDNFNQTVLEDQLPQFVVKDSPDSIG